MGAHPVRVGRYRLTGRLLGRGAQASVHEALAEPEGTRVALKRFHPEAVLLHPELAARAEREARLLGGAGLPGVVRLLDAGTAEGVPFLVYELVEEARPLDQALGERSLAERLRLVRDAAQAVGTLHRQGVVHRDLTPGNVLVDGAGRVWLTDLGLSAGAGEPRLTRTGEILGTAGWLAPEAGLHGSRDAATPAADVWALGVHLFQALTGSHPFPGLGLSEVLEALRKGPPSPRALCTTCPPALDHLCRRALELRPEARPRDGAALASELDAALQALPLSAAPLGPGRRVGRWTIQRALGAGGMGQVFLAKDEQLQREVALKLLTGPIAPQRRERFRREVTAATLARHPSLVAVHEAGEVGGTPFLVMDLVEGEPLDRVLARGPLAPREAARVARELAGALAALHAAGVLHRDVKPSNVLLEPDGRPRLVDLGVAHLRDAERLTRTGALVGTPVYMAPELFGGAEADERADVYGVGTVLYEALTGEPPAESATLTELMLEKQRPPRPPSRLRPRLDPALEALCLQALQPAPARRIASAVALEQGLTLWLEGRAPVPGRRRRALLAAGLAALAAGALLAVRGWSERAPPPLDLAALREQVEARGRACASLSELGLAGDLPAALASARPAGGAADVARLWTWVGLERLAGGDREGAQRAAAAAGPLIDPARDLLEGGLRAGEDPGEALLALARAEQGGLAPRELFVWRFEALQARGVLDRARAEEALRALERAGQAADTPAGALLRLSALCALNRPEEAAAARARLDPGALDAQQAWELALLDAHTHLTAGRLAEALAALPDQRSGPPPSSLRGAQLAERARELLAPGLASLVANRRAPTDAETAPLALALRLHAAVSPEPLPPAPRAQALEVIHMCRMGGEPRPVLSLALARACPRDPEALFLAAEHLRGQLHRYDERRRALDDELLAAARAAWAVVPADVRPAAGALVVRGLICKARWEEADVEARDQLEALTSPATAEVEPHARAYVEADLLVLRAMALRHLGRAREGLALLERRAKLPETIETEEEARLERLLTSMFVSPEQGLAEARRFLRLLEGRVRGDLSRPLECAWLVFTRLARWEEAELLSRRAIADGQPRHWARRLALTLVRRDDLSGAAAAVRELDAGLADALLAGDKKGRERLERLIEGVERDARAMISGLPERWPGDGGE